MINVLSTTFTYRLNIESLQNNKLEFKKLRTAYRAHKELKFEDDRGFLHIAGHHGVPGFYCWHAQRNTRTFLRARLFLPWHRAYLHHFEKRFQEISGIPNIGVPWWDWTSEETRKKGIPKAFSVASIEGEANPLYGTRFPFPPPDGSHTETWRGDNKDLITNIRNLIPTSDELDRQIKARSDYGDFSDYLENLHDTIHGSVGGSMASVPIAAFDPVFWSHHAYVDLVWYKWQLLHGYDKGLENMMNVPLPPTDLIVRDTIRMVETLGYEYADTVVSLQEPISQR